MPKKPDRISDELLLANGVWDLDPTLPLSPRQVQLITGLSMDQLKERRRTNPPKPPFPFRSDDDKPGSAIWYPLGEALAYKRSRLPRPLSALSPPVTSGRTFSSFLAQALPADVWLFQRTQDGRWIDFFTAIRLGQWNDPEGEAECAWLTLESYLADTSRWASLQLSCTQERLFKSTLTAQTESGKRVSPRVELSLKGSPKRRSL